MSDSTNTQTFGFVCPDWAKKIWNQNECTVEATTESGVFVVLDHSIQAVVYRGHTREECESWLGREPATLEERADSAQFNADMETFFDLMAEKRGPAAVVTFIEDSGFVTCPYCGEHYWSEDGHPSGTLCPKFGIDAEKEHAKPKQEEPGFVVCKKHNKRYWYEDFCPDCEAENPE